MGAILYHKTMDALSLCIRFRQLPVVFELTTIRPEQALKALTTKHREPSTTPSKRRYGIC
jgi:hypothetical protein